MRSTIEEAANWAKDEFLPKAPLPSIVVIVVVIISATMMSPSFGSLIAIMIICGFAYVYAEIYKAVGEQRNIICRLIKRLL